MDYLVTYDIHDDRRRNKVAKILADYGRRVQFSVFEIAGLAERQLEQCIRRVVSRIDPDEGDSVRVYSFCRECAGRIVVHGKGEIMRRDDDLTIV